VGGAIPEFDPFKRIVIAVHLQNPHGEKQGDPGLPRTTDVADGRSSLAAKNRAEYFPDDRGDKVEQKLLSSAFSLREKPVAKSCGFLPFSILCEKLAGIGELGLSASLKHRFLNNDSGVLRSEAKPAASDRGQQCPRLMTLGWKGTA